VSAEEPAGVTTSELVAGVTLLLKNEGEHCVLKYSGPMGTGRLQLALPAACSFHRTGQGVIRVHTYGRGREHVFLVEHSRPHPTLSQDCETRVQAIRITPKKVAVSPHTDRVASCPPFQWDEAMFRGLFE
jgi:hypothetical protein